MIKTISYDQHEIIQDIINLHCPYGIDCDLTYSKGNFYKKIEEPRYKFDINPLTHDTVKADSRNIPLLDNSMNTLMFDPPFVAAIPKKNAEGIITKRFGYFRNVPKLWKYYNETIGECYRVLKSNGILIFKCQDTVDSSKQYFSHVQIMNYAVSAGFYPKDLFMLLAKHRLTGSSWKVQQHARKYHCYFWVFKKEQSKVIYERIDYR